ncbi:hypothetical protein ATX59_09395 [Oenococcus oeni]|uniref:Uncharacterized protein n=1 Tax=Oenococcus oeni TaxID=1247 RepID=A0A6N3ZYE3_OENOE|nr:hypothetical protein [Oenococcus oeni]OIM20341.1 hypothetical protein ATX59_09395 [Oenococcus oeni]
MTIKDIKKPENVRSGQTYNINGLDIRDTKNSIYSYSNENSDSNQKNDEDTINGLTEANYKELYTSLEKYLNRINLRAVFSQLFLIDQYELLLEKGYTKLAATYYRQLENMRTIEQLSQHLEHHYGDELKDIRIFDKEVD